ncbi:MAG: DUF3429 domain-containing protein [Pseudomonadota bacterium]
MSERRQTEMTTLGFLGLIPFWAGALALWASPMIVPVFVALDFHRIALAYGALIVAYLAGVGSGGGLSPDKSQYRSFLPGQLIVLGAFAVLILGGVFQFALGDAWRHVVIIVLLVYLLLRDLAAVTEGRLPAWYGKLRVRLTFWASAALILIALRLFLWGQY